MIPILLISKSTDATSRFISEYALKNSFSDLHIQHIYPIKTTISIDQSREIRDDAQRGTARKMLVIHNFDTAQTEAQNALLKTLEESNKHIQFVLEISDENAILPTIRSRSIVVRATIDETLQNDALKVIEDYAFNQSFNTSSAMKLSHRIKKEEAEVVLNSLLYHLHAKVLEGEYSKPIAESISYVLQQRNALMRSNVNPEYTLDAVFLKIAPLKIV